MIDLALFVQLLEAVPLHAHLLIIGDAKQLPAIEAGNILASLLDTAATSGSFMDLPQAHMSLETNHRQANHPGLSRLAQDCLLEASDTVIEHLAANAYDSVAWQDFSPRALADATNLALSHYAQLPVCATAQEALHCARQLTILTAIHEGPSGCKAINAEIARSLNPGFLPFFHGQLLLITENARHLGLSNGDIAIVWRQANQVLMACFETNGQLQTIATSALPAFELAYALTIHKSQGSEYEDVTVVLPELDNAVLSQALLYTAFTRARRQLRILASAERLRSSLMKSNARINGLQQLMQPSVK